MIISLRVFHSLIFATLHRCFNYFDRNIAEIILSMLILLIPVTCSQLRSIQFRRLVLKSPWWGKCAKKLGCASSRISSLQSLQSVAAGRMRIRVFLHTYPTYARVGGTSRPAGETVGITGGQMVTFSWFLKVFGSVSQLVRLFWATSASQSCVSTDSSEAWKVCTF